MNNKRIAHFIETGVPGGAETLMLQLCECIKTTDNNPVIFHNGHQYFVEQCNMLGIEQYVPTGFNYFKSTKTLPLFAFKFKKFLQEQKIDLLHSHLFGPVTGAAAAAKLAGVPHIGTLHDVYMVEEKPARVRLLQLASLLGTKLITVSKTMENFYRDKAFFKPYQITTIYNGVKCLPTMPLDIQQQFGIADDELVIINVGRLVPLKRHDILLNAVATLNPAESWRLLIVGDGPEKANIENKIQALQLQDKVVMTGQRQDVEKLLAAADLFVQCSDTEGLSMSIMEAMAAGLPCVVTDVGGNRELIQHNTNGLLATPGDSSTLAAGLAALLMDKALRTAMRQRTLEKVKNYFNLEVTYQQYVQCYQQLLG